MSQEEHLSEPRHHIYALIVDDEDQTLRSDLPHLKTNLHDLGVDVDFDYCSTVEAAIELLNPDEHHYRLVVSDLLFTHQGVRRPRVEAIRRARRRDDVVVVALTMNDDPQYPRLAEQARDAGAHLFAYRLELVTDGPNNWEALCRKIYDCLEDVRAIPSTRKRPFHPSPAVKEVIALFERFPLLAHVLARRGRDRVPLTIEDEYDVQYLFRGILAMTFPDVRVEDATKEVAGRGARIDFVLPDERVLIEIKRPRNAAHARDLGGEVAEDFLRYRGHRDARLLVVLVYDPERLIDNPVGFERDLIQSEGDLAVVATVAPKLVPPALTI
jgi:hypothetical protein